MSQDQRNWADVLELLFEKHGTEKVMKSLNGVLLPGSIKEDGTVVSREEFAKTAYVKLEVDSDA